jgi:hypothetical protein
MSGSFTKASAIITNTITTITCQVNKNGAYFSEPFVNINTNITLPLTKATTITGGQGAGGNYVYSFKQYFLNATINFKPTIENTTNTYTIVFTINGTGTFEYNTTTYNV